LKSKSCVDWSGVAAFVAGLGFEDNTVAKPPSEVEVIVQQMPEGSALLQRMTAVGVDGV